MSQDQEPPHRIFRLGNLFVVEWIGKILPPHLYWVLDRTREASLAAGGPIISFSLITNKCEVPDENIRRLMGMLQPELSSYQSSSHLIIMSTIIFFVIRAQSTIASFMRGTGGNLYDHRDVKSALEKVQELKTPLPASPEQILQALSANGFPIR